MAFGTSTRTRRKLGACLQACDASKENCRLRLLEAQARPPARAKPPEPAAPPERAPEPREPIPPARSDARDPGSAPEPAIAEDTSAAPEAEEPTSSEARRPGPKLFEKRRRVLESPDQLLPTAGEAN